jgi:hypothetical protein
MRDNELKTQQIKVLEDKLNEYRKDSVEWWI